MDPSGACVLCPKGTYSSSSGASECVLAEQGRYVGVEGASGSSECVWAFGQGTSGCESLVDRGREGVCYECL